MRVDQKVIPGKSIGMLELGMTQAEVEAYTAQSPFAIQCEYVADHAAFIEVSGSGEIEFDCIYAGMDLFRTPAEELIARLDALSPYRRDEDAELGFRYLFPELGMLLWRSRIMREEDREADWYKEMPPENQEDELRFRFFETAAVFTPAWLEQLYTIE
ncbi:hypothetical protein B9G55_00435 [Saccharibacillus sp. O16]|nr:hypothetical protein B9G55_00435 [Saccharibacillus sp. O16]